MALERAQNLSTGGAYAAKQDRLRGFIFGLRFGRFGMLPCLLHTEVTIWCLCSCASIGLAWPTETWIPNNSRYRSASCPMQDSQCVLRGAAGGVRVAVSFPVTVAS